MRTRVSAAVAGLSAAAAWMLLAPAVAADAPTPLPVMPPEGEAYEVELAETDEPKHATLRFLDENREFFRARLDELRMTLRDDWEGFAGALDPRWLAWQQMLAEIGAARDSAAVSEEWIRRRELLESVGELVELETEMDEMEELLDAQGARLVQLEDDFIGRQRTALVVLLTGAPASGTPTGVVIRDPDGPVHRVALAEESRESLVRGASAELLHRLVEPRSHSLEISFEGAGWSDAPPYAVRVEPERDRITFLEIDLGDAEPSASRPPTARRWVR